MRIEDSKTDRLESGFINKYRIFESMALSLTNFIQN